MKSILTILLIANSVLASGTNYYERAKESFDKATPLPLKDNLYLKLKPIERATCVQYSKQNKLEKIVIDTLHVDTFMAIGPMIIITAPHDYWQLLSKPDGEFEGENEGVKFTLRKAKSLSGSEYWVSRWVSNSGCYFETYCWWTL